MNILSKIPFRYQIIAFVVILLSVSTAVYFKGYNKAENHYKAEITLLTEQHDSALKQIELDSEKTISTLKDEVAILSNKVVTRYVDRVNTIYRDNIVYRDVIRTIPGTPIDNRLVDVHDSIVNNTEVPSTSTPRTEPVTDVDFAARVASNYAICQANAEQLIALQAWVRETQAAANAQNGDNR